MSWTGYRPWTSDYELDLIELGRRVATAYDESYALAYRIGEALGIPRADVPLRWQRMFGVRSVPNTEHPEEP